MSFGPNLPSPVPSPCVNVCRMDEDSGWCAGCLRTIDEIARWASLDDEARREVWGDLARRRLAWERRHPTTTAGPR